MGCQAKRDSLIPDCLLHIKIQYAWRRMDMSKYEHALPFIEEYSWLVIGVD